MTKLLVIGCVVALALAGGVQAAHADEYGRVESPALEAKLPLDMPVYTWSYDNSCAYAGDRKQGITLAGWAADLLLHGKPGDIDPRMQLSWATAARVLYHEFWHVAFNEHDEQNADLGSVVMLRWSLRTYWSMSAAQAQAQYEMVVGPIGVAAPVGTYRPMYTATAVDPLLAEGVR